MVSHSHITLIVPEKLDQSTRKGWMTTAISHMPDGLHASATIRAGGEMRASKGYSYERDGHWHYVIPMSRDLQISEVQVIASAWDQNHPQGDFQIDYSTPGEADEQYTEIETNGLKEIAMSAAKAYHTRWVSEQSDQGWSYGIRYDRQNKRDPMLVPWDNLSDRIKLRELRRFQALMEILDQMDLRLSRKR